MSEGQNTPRLGIYMNGSIRHINIVDMHANSVLYGDAHVRATDGAFPLTIDTHWPFTQYSNQYDWCVLAAVVIMTDEKCRQNLMA